MDNRQTNDLDNGLNEVNPLNRRVGVPEEDLTNIFNTPVDDNITNLGVGETSSNYSNEIGEETEVLDIEEPVSTDNTVAFKEFDNVVPVEIVNNTDGLGVVDHSDFVDANAGLETTDTVTPDSSPVDVPGSTTETITSETGMTETTMGMQPNVMNNNDLNPVDLPVDSVETVVNSDEPQAGNQDFLINQAPPLVPPTLNNGIENNDMEKPKKKKKFVLPLIIVIALLAILVGLYFVFFTGPKKVFDKAISKSFDYLRENIANSTSYDVVSGKGSLSYEITTSDQDMQSVLDIFNGIALDYNYAVDYQNKLMSFDLNSSYNNDDLLAISMYGENNKMYILLKDIYAKYISSDVEGYDNLFNVTKNGDELKTILNSAERALTKSLTKSDFVKSEETIKVDGKDVKVTKNALVLTNANFNRICKSLLTILKDDVDFISAVNKISADDNVDTKAALEAALDDVGEVDPDDKTVITLSIYTEGLLKDIVKFAFDMKDDDNNVAFSITKTTENNYALVATQNNEDIVTGTIKTNVTKGDKTISNDMEIFVSVPDMVNVKLNVKSSIAYDTTFNKIDTTNSVDYNALTDEEITAIGTKLMSNEGLVNLINNFNAIFGSTNYGVNDYGTSTGLLDSYDYNV